MMEIRDELEVPGHVMMLEIMTQKEAIKKLESIMDDWEIKGYKTINDVPEGASKQYFREISKAIGFQVAF